MVQVNQPTLALPHTLNLFPQIFKFEEKYELAHDKINKLACVPCVDSDLPSLIVLLCAFWVAME